MVACCREYVLLHSLILHSFYYEIFDNNLELSKLPGGILSLPRVRMHYGHPDVFDRIFHITRGGISKASRVINISEDIYAGG